MTSRTGLSMSLVVAVAVATVAALVVGLTVFSGGERRTASGDGDPGMVHVHGLGVNPADGHIYVATHVGLWRIDDGGDAERIGDYFHDLMGFTIVGPDHFLASGHPSPEDDLPPLLGLMESTDAGATWENVSLLGEADFHALVATHGQIYGWDSTQQRFMVSDDGRSWEVRAGLALRDLAVHPDDPDHVVVATPGGVGRSADGGRTWEGLAQADLVWLAWRSADLLVSADPEGQLLVSADAGASWETVGELPGPVEALVDDDGRLYAFVSHDGLYASDDDGRTWERVYEAEGDR